MLYHGFGSVARELAPEVSNTAALTVETAMTLAVVILSWRWMSRRRCRSRTDDLTDNP